MPLNRLVNLTGYVLFMEKVGHNVLKATKQHHIHGWTICQALNETLVYHPALAHTLYVHLSRGVAWFFHLGTHRTGIVKRVPKVQASRGVGGMLPQKIFIFTAWEMPFPIFSREKFYKSKYEKC